MQLNSYELILALLPISLLAYFTIGRINVMLRKLVICASGLTVYAFAGVKGLVILLASMVVNYLLCEIMLETKYMKKPALIIAVSFNALALLLFKYSDFAITNINTIFGKEINLLNLSMPLGISFFTFQQIAYVVNIYQGKIEKLNVLDYSAYILYFPKLIMGPIVDAPKLIDDMSDPAKTKWNFEHFISGIKLFSFGLFKKMVLADTFAKAVSWGAENLEAATSLDLIVIMLSYTFEIYFDFSGYSDMAIGVSDMFNIELPTNFNSPYKAISIRDFWNRWHMSLTGFLTKYIYIPLGGSRKGKIRTYLNTVIVFLISGIWHGANWTFILWGLLHGALSIFDRLTEAFQNKIIKPIRWFVTFAVINILWLLFNAGSVGEWIYMLKKIAFGFSFSLTPELLVCFRGAEIPFFEQLLHIGSLSISVTGLLWMLVFVIVGFCICLALKNNREIEKDNKYAYMVLAAVAFSWSFLYLGSESVFIYNNF